MWSQVVARQDGQQRVFHKELADTSKICQFLRMNPLEFTGSNVTKDLENFVKELQNVFELKGVARIWYDQWKKSRDERAPLVSWALLESAFLGRFFPRELKEAKIGNFMSECPRSRKLNGNGGNGAQFSSTARVNRATP
ncbi:uncharacterized protein LOC125825078 [Solanum verrucosum]|uniref:uncharacterized protein LOC125825078 n=1 Tax=Solanum verrucosum TaxID=315347 RepID=UPI0020D1AB63|nr:uncharacterized protein LOC125825078 [Solanum verrucosum]